METVNNDTSNYPLKLDFETFLERIESYDEKKEVKIEKSKDTPLKLDFETFLERIESYDEKATQLQTPTLTPVVEPPVVEAQATPIPPAKKSLLERLTKTFSSKKPKNQPDVPADPSRRKFLKLSSAVIGTVLVGAPGGKTLLDVVGGGIAETKKQYLESNFMNDIFIPVLSNEAKKRRSNNPEAEGIDPELAKEVDFSILVTGSGSELTDYGERNADAIQLVTFSKKHGVKIIAIHRDIQSPEVYEAAKNSAEQKGEKVPEVYESEVMRSLRAGGPDLLKKVTQHITGAPVDFYLEIEHDAVPEIIDTLFGNKGINVDVPEDIPPDIYGRRGFKKGPQMMNGEDINVFVKTRTSSTMERRNSAQQEVLKIVMQEYFKRLKTNNIQESTDMLLKTKNTLDKLQKEGKLIIDLPIGDILLTLGSKWSRMGANIVSQRSSFFNLPTIPPGLVFAEGGDLKRAENRGPRDALMNPIDKTTGTAILPDLSHKNTIQELVNYYRSLRENSRKFITAV